MIFVVGDSPTITNTFSVSGVPTDPTTISLAVTDPAGATTTYTYALGQITRVSTGVYSKQITVATAGDWLYVWTGTGAAADVQDGAFHVRELFSPEDPAYDIITVAEARRHLNIPNSDTAITTALAEVVTEASRLIDDLCGPVVRRNVTETILEPCGPLFLKVPPGSPTFTVTFTSVTEYNGGSALVLTAEDFDTAGTYRWEPRTGRLLRRSSWTHYAWAPQEVVVAYEGGRFNTTALVSQKFKGACRKVLMHKWQARGSQSGFGTVGGDGAPFGGVPYSPKTLLDHLRVDLKDELLLDSAVSGFA